MDGTKSILDEYNGVQRQIQNHAPHAVYINCRDPRLALFKKTFNGWLPVVENRRLCWGYQKHFISAVKIVI